MSGDDELNAWRAALAEASRPDPGLRALHLSRAREGFERLHAAPAVAGPGRRWGVGGWAGGSLATALAALGILAVTPLGQDLWQRPGIAPGDVEEALAQEAEATAADDPMAPAPVPAPPVPLPAGEAARPARAPADAMAPDMADAAAARLAPAPVDADSLATAAPAPAAAAPPLAAEAAPAAEDALAAVRRALIAGALPPPDSVDVEALVGRVLQDAAPGGEAPRPTVTVASTPWDASTLLVTVVAGRAERGRGVEPRIDWDPTTVLAARRLGQAAGDDVLRAGPSAGQAVAAIWEVTPVAPPAGPAGAALGLLRLGGSTEAVAVPFASTPAAEARLAAAVAGWALLLRGEDLGTWGLAEAAALAASLTPEGQRTEVLGLMRLSAKLRP